MPAAVINKLEAGHPDEPADCAMVALKAYLDVSYTDIIRCATLRDSCEGKRGLWPATAIKIAADLGHALKRTRLTEDSYGVVFVPGHAAMVRNGLVFDRKEVMPLRVWMKKQKVPRSRATVLVAVDE